MKIVSFSRNGQNGYGAVSGDGVIDLSAHYGKKWPLLDDVLSDDSLEQLQDGALNHSTDFGLEEIEYLPPIINPGRILCIGLNYKTHIKEMNRDMPEYPALFARHPDSHVGHNQSMIRPKVSDKFDYEGELAFIVGKSGRHIKAKDALQYVAGYSCYNDGSIRDYQRHTSQFTAGKNFWHSGAFGPWMVTMDELPDWSEMNLETRLNGEVMQHTGINDLLFGVEELVEYLSKIFPIQPGDVVCTGTTGGVGAARKPPVFMKSGDKIEIEISGIGLLSNTIEDE